MFVFRDSELPLNREIRSSFQSILGVGKRKSNLVADRVGLAFPFFINNLNSYNFTLCFFLLKLVTISDVKLKRFYVQNIANQVNISSYKGLRHSMFLPVRGQRTRTNAGTWKYLRKHSDKVL